VQGVFAHLAKMDLDFVDCVSYLFCDGGAWGLGCSRLIFQWHTPFGWLVFGNKSRQFAILLFWRLWCSGYEIGLLYCRVWRLWITQLF